MFRRALFRTAAAVEFFNRQPAFIACLHDVVAKRQAVQQCRGHLGITKHVARCSVGETVVDIFDAVGLEKPNIGLLDDEFLAQVQNPPEKNLMPSIFRKASLAVWLKVWLNFSIWFQKDKRVSRH